jgi:hypothetical protein
MPVLLIGSKQTLRRGRLGLGGKEGKDGERKV